MGPPDRDRRVFWENSINFLEIDEFALNYPEPRIWTPRRDEFYVYIGQWRTREFENDLVINHRIPNGLMSTNHPRIMQGKVWIRWKTRLINRIVINYSTHARIGKKGVYACVSRNELERILESKRDRIIVTKFEWG